MNGKREKPDESRDQRVCSLDNLLIWLENQAGVSNAAAISKVLVSASRQSLLAGTETAKLEADGLGQRVHDATSCAVPKDGDWARWIRNAAILKWWSVRRSAMSGFLLTQGCKWQPVLAHETGGGRGNASTWWIDFEPLVAIEESANAPSAEPTDAEESNISPVRYVRNPGIAAFGLNWLFGHGAFRSGSPRGWIVTIGWLAMCVMLIAPWALLLSTLQSKSAFSPAQLSFLLLAMFLSWAFWQALRPWARLPTQRVVMAPAIYLALHEFRAQFELVRDRESRRPIGWLSLVRFSGTCPLCAGLVELHEGNADFPGRLIGRCTDSPREHVFGFDPVSLQGPLLRPEWKRIESFPPDVYR